MQGSVLRKSEPGAHSYNHQNTQPSWRYCCSAAKSCPTLCDPLDCGIPGSSVLHYLPDSAQIHVHWVGDAIQPSHPLSPPLLFLPLILLSTRVFSNELALHIGWPKYQSFRFSISPSNEYSGLISFRIDSLISLQWRVDRIFTHDFSDSRFDT